MTEPMDPHQIESAGTTSTGVGPLDRIIWSADVQDDHALERVLRQCNGRLRNVKLDRLYLTGRGFDTVRQLNDWGLNVFIDAKLVEIPSKLEALARKYVVCGPWMLNCMAGAMSNGNCAGATPDDELDGLKRFADVCLEAEVRPCGVTVLTSKTPSVVKLEHQRGVIDQVLLYVGALIDCGFTDVVCSPQEAEAIRERFSNYEITINTPGVRLPDSRADDQARVMTPSKALAAGADRLVIGRPITEGNPAANLDRIVAEMTA